MKLTIDRAHLLKALNHVQSVVERRNTIQILSNVLIEAENGRLTLSATDMDVAIVETVAGDPLESGATTVPALTLYDIVRKLPDGADVELVTAGDSGQLEVRAGRSRFKLACLPKENFPALSGGDFPHVFGLPAQELRQLIDRTRFAISTEETRYYLNGIYVHPAGESGQQTLRAAATDGHRLARAEVALPQGAEEIPGVIIPRKTVAEIRKLIDEFDGVVEVGLSETRIRFSFDDVVMTSKLIDGTFPDYERVIPAGNNQVLEVDGKALASAVDRVSTIATDKARAVKLALAPNLLTVSASSSDAGFADEELEVDFDGPALEIGFNARYLLDIAAQIEGPTLRIMLADGNAPTLLKDADDGSAVYVLMPMRV